MLIALPENATPFVFRQIAPDQSGHVAEWMRRWGQFLDRFLDQHVMDAARPDRKLFPLGAPDRD